MANEISAIHLSPSYAYLQVKRVKLGKYLVLEKWRYFRRNGNDKQEVKSWDGKKIFPVYHSHELINQIPEQMSFYFIHLTSNSDKDGPVLVWAYHPL